MTDQLTHVQMKLKYLPILSATLAGLALILTTACHDSRREAIGSTEVLIETSEGDIVVRLYDDTPLHRDNFISHVKAGHYDGLLFNRIVPEMVIQAGDTSLHASLTTAQHRSTGAQGGDRQEAEGLQAGAKGSKHLETGEQEATVPPEIVYPRHFHKQGALAAAREPDSINPGRRSSALQWYIVTGKKMTSAELSELQALRYDARVTDLFDQLCRQHADELEALKTSDREAQQALLNRLQREAEETVAANPPQPYNDTQRQTYARIGGAPHLDGDYTVFGEVVEGMPIALRIGRTPVDAKERPRRSVYIKSISIMD